MAEVTTSKNIALSRIESIVDQLMQTNSLYQEELSKEEVMAIYANLLDKVSPEMLMALDDERLTKRVRRVMATQMMTKLLDGLTPEEVEIFNAAVEGR
ncbi:MAG TPA: hypothetical protein IGS52_20245 [Oscillatoriaceae cyanobacterium M33_DOE_052]|uniref:Uncharacterized protein n=1 Tax=Planktothricoides sp. SpSt-374 TaxID=2282167 RepID=A0A7C3ZHV5_9CYAN|nr:hypothetical protein [Oscillatoriaceae cyanobacterium M33_DOE_052]